MLPFDGKPLPSSKEIKSAGTAFAEGLAGLLSAAIVMALFWLCVAAYNALFETVYGRPAHLVLFVAIGLAALGAVFYFFRDLRKSRIVAAVQVTIAVVAGTVSTIGADTVELKALAALVAVVVIANGASKLMGR
jgi:peptidoglycan/LPS O-acetylase OafA/YrhL